MPEANLDIATVEAYGFVTGEACAWAFGIPTYPDEAASVDEESVSVEAGGSASAPLGGTHGETNRGNRRPPPERKPVERKSVRFDFGF